MLAGSAKPNRKVENEVTMATKAKNIKVAQSSERLCVFTFPNGKKTRYTVPLELTAAEIVARANAWIASDDAQSKYPGLTLEQCKLHWIPAIEEVQ